MNNFTENNRWIIYKNTQFPYLIIFMIAFSDQYVMLMLANKISGAILKNMISGSVLLYGIFLVLYLFKFNEIVNNLITKRAWDVWIVLTLILVSILLYNFNGWERRMIAPQDGMVRLLFFSFPVYMMARSIMDYNYIIERLWIIAYIFFSFCIITMFSAPSLMTQQGYETNMVKGYQFGLCALIWLENYIHSDSKTMINRINLIMGIASFLMVIAYGSRGTLIVCFVFLLAIALEKIIIGNAKKYILIIPLIVLLVYLFWGEIINAMINLFSTMGINSRTIAWLLQSDSSLDSSGRNDLYRYAFKYISENPVFGYGILGDRMLLGRYVHNLFLELLLDFGVPVGGIISVLIIYRSIRSYVSKYTHRISIIVIYAVVQLMFSGSFLHNGSFWLALGIMLNTSFVWAEFNDYDKL